MGDLNQAVALFTSTFILVFTLGLQSQLVNRGHYVAAFLNSALIGTANLMLFKLAPNATGIEIIGFLSGGPFGIITSMHVYKKFFSHRAKNSP